MCISVTKYGYHIENIGHTAIMTNKYVDPTFLHIFPKTWHITIPTSHGIVKYVPATKCLPNGYISKIFDDRYRECIHIYISHMKSLASAIQQGAYLTYITEGIWLPHWKYSSHSQYATLAYRPKILHIYAKIHPTATSTLHFATQHVHQTEHVSYICQNPMEIYVRCICTCLTCMRSLASTIQQRALYIYLTCVTKQIWLSHCNRADTVNILYMDV